MRSTLSLVAFICLFAISSFGQSKYSRVKIDLTKTDIKDINALGLEIDHGFMIPGVHFVNDFSDSEIKLLEDAGIEKFVLIDDLKAHYKLNKTQDQYRGAPICEDDVVVYDYLTPENYTYGSMGGYHTFEELLIVLDSMRMKFPNLITAKAPVGTIKTWEGHDIWWLKISDNPEVDEEEPEGLYTALHHAREPNGLSQMIFYMWYLLENYETDEEVKYLVDNTELYFMPCLNPDGYLYNESTDPEGGGFWRKNRRPESNDDEVGVDLNRNYGFFWGFDDGGSSPAKESSTYRGPAPFSEPETQAVRDFSIDHEFRIALNYHSFGNLLIHPWGYNDGLTAEDALFKAIGGTMTKENSFVLGTGTETVGYQVNGNSDDYLYGDTGEKDKIYSLTPEVGSGFWPQQDEIDGFNKSCMHQNLTLAHCLLNYYDVRVTDLPKIYESKTGTFSFEITKSGLMTGDAIITISSNSPFLLMDKVFNGVSLEAPDKMIVDVPFEMSADAPPLSDVSFDVTVDIGGIILTDTYIFTYRNAITTELVSNEITTIDDWTKSDISLWNLTESEFVSAPYSLTDSPGGNYPASTENIIILSEYIDLTDIEAAVLKFSAKYDLESNYDYCLVQASSDGENWTSLCGNHTRNGSLNTHGTSDPLFDGTKDWLQEEMDLSDFIGQQIQLRLVVVSDGFVELDGFYIDNIVVESQVLVYTNTEDEFVDRISVFPTLGDGHIQLTINKLDTKKVLVQILTADGSLIKSINVSEEHTAIDLSENESGIYFVKVFSAGKTSIKKVTIVK